MRKPFTYLYKLIVILIITTTVSHAQTAASKRTILKGRVNINTKNGPVLPYANIRNQSKNTGTITNTDGIFLLYVNAGDTLHFSAVGYKTSYAIVPLSVKDSSNFSAAYIMFKDTLTLKETTIRANAREFELRNGMLQNVPNLEPTVNSGVMIKSETAPLKNVPAGMGSPASFLYEKLYKPMEKRKIKKRSADGRIAVPMAK